MPYPSKVKHYHVKCGREGTDVLFSKTSRIKGIGEWKVRRI